MGSVLSTAQDDGYDGNLRSSWPALPAPFSFWCFRDRVMGPATCLSAYSSSPGRAYSVHRVLLQTKVTQMRPSVGTVITFRLSPPSHHYTEEVAPLW